LQNSLPSLDGLPPEFIENLTELENLENKELRKVLHETVPPKTQAEISKLLNKKGKLTASEILRLTNLQKKAALIMLRKARAAVLLRFRGHRLSTLTELENLSLPE
jgi:plasmid maintenance system antidote protein VapI